MFMLSHTTKKINIFKFAIYILLNPADQRPFSLHAAVQTLFILNVCPCKNIFVAQVKVDYTLLQLETCFVAWCML